MNERVVVGTENVDDPPLFVTFAGCAGAQNLPPPRPPLLPPRGGALISGGLATTVKPTRSGCAWFATALSGEYTRRASSAFRN